MGLPGGARLPPHLFPGQGGAQAKAPIGAEVKEGKPLSRDTGAAERQTSPGLNPAVGVTGGVTAECHDTDMGVSPQLDTVYLENTFMWVSVSFMK